MSHAYRSLCLAGFCLHAVGTQAGESAPFASAVIRGSSAYAPVDLFPAYRDQLGNIIDAKSAREVIAGIEAMYARDGYLKPRIQVWDDLLPEGILRVDVHEVWVVDAVVQGDAGPYAERVKQAAQQLMTELPLRSRSIPDALQSLRGLPGLDLAANVAEQPGAEGGIVLKLRAAYRPLNVTMQWSNRGTEEVGPNFYSVQVVENNLLHARERIGAFFSTAAPTSEYHMVGGFAEVPVGTLDTQLSLSGFHSNSQPTLGGTQYDLFYPQDSISLSVSHWFVNRDRFALSAGFGADYTDTRIIFEGLEMESDQLRVAQMNLRLQGMVGEAGAYTLSLRWRRGLDAFGSGIVFYDGSTLDPAYDVGALDFAYTAPIGSSLRWSLGLVGQMSSRELPFVEQFKVGGMQLGRGLRAAMLAGESGAGAKFELSYHFRNVPPWLGTTSVFGYSDHGTVWQRGVPDSQYLGTAGVGLQTELAWGRLAAEIGKPVTFSGSKPAGTSSFVEAQIRF
jgi:hemolysin activation/secretion protein